MEQAEGGLPASFRAAFAEPPQQDRERLPHALLPAGDEREAFGPGRVQIVLGERPDARVHAGQQRRAQHLAGLRGLFDVLSVEPCGTRAAVEPGLDIGLQRRDLAARRRAASVSQFRVRRRDDVHVLERPGGGRGGRPESAIRWIVQVRTGDRSQFTRPTRLPLPGPSGRASSSRQAGQNVVRVRGANPDWNRCPLYSWRPSPALRKAPSPIAERAIPVTAASRSSVSGDASRTSLRLRPINPMKPVGSMPVSARATRAIQDITVSPGRIGVPHALNPMFTPSPSVCAAASRARPRTPPPRRRARASPSRGPRRRCPPRRSPPACSRPRRSA